MEQATSVKTEQAFQLPDRVNRISVSPTMAISYATSIDRIEEGLRRLSHFFSSAK